MYRKIERIEKQGKVEGEKITNERAHIDMLPDSCCARAGRRHKSLLEQVCNKRIQFHYDTNLEPTRKEKGKKKKIKTLYKNFIYKFENYI